MKNYIFIAVASLMITTACKTDPTKDTRAAMERDSLLKVIDERELSVNEFISSFNEVEKNLNEVSRKQNIILSSSGKGDLKASKKERINAEIKAINDLMDANTKALKQLKTKLNSSNTKNVQLEKTVENLNNQLNLKYFELADLNEKLNILHAQVAQLQILVDTLYNQNMAQNETINNQTAELRTAYYIVGKSNDLETFELIDKKGGLLGFGETAQLSNNLDKSMFTKIDYNETTIIPVNSKGIKIITTHPTGSFSLNKTGRMVNSIVISDPGKFWSASKYLVVSK